jgi:hypothetical protein
MRVTHLSSQFWDSFSLVFGSGTDELSILGLCDLAFGCGTES